VPLSELAVAVVRDRILLASNDDRIFAGTLRASLSGTTIAPDKGVLDALHAASAEDIIAALDDGLDSEVEEKGRNFSGGQLQRLRLARALIADPEILLAVEPTSAVDAHTEARIAERIGAYRARAAHCEDERGGGEGTSPGMRTTVLFTTSPLVLDHVEVVAYVEDGKVVATGKHGDLLARQRGYRSLVTRGEDEGSEDEGEGDGGGSRRGSDADAVAVDVRASASASASVGEGAGAGAGTGIGDGAGDGDEGGAGDVAAGVSGASASASAGDAWGGAVRP
jgi:hypothetical protein